VSHIFPEATSTVKKIHSKIAPTPINETGTVVVDLTSLNQQIDFLLPDGNSK
jgi:hypothetical protein